MQTLLPLIIYIPLLLFVVTLFINRTREQLITRLIISGIIAHIAVILALSINYALNTFENIELTHLTLYETKNFKFFIHFRFDSITAVFAITGAIILLLVSIFSKYYMHRDEGFSRFFNILILFYLGYNLVVFSGNFETLFIGWEILGFTSFLLIGYYRDRYLPVKNALKVISLYRVGDVCLIFSMWLLHHLVHHNLTFSELDNAGLIQTMLNLNPVGVSILCLLLLIAAWIKSAQFPFSFWLPRAMEGPTVSSAIFYGSLSIHLGVFLLIRTHILWESLVWFKIVIFVFGVLTALIASSIASVQPTVKTQIAYASIAQIGLMFAEISLGWYKLALLHFTGNAALRTYQLLVSPSVLSYLIHDIVYTHEPNRKKLQFTLLQRIRNSVYVLNIKEWSMDTLMFNLLWNPAKTLGRFVNKINPVAIFIIIALSVMLAVILLWTNAGNYAVFSMLILYIFTLALVLSSFAERFYVKKAWYNVLVAQLLFGCSFFFVLPVDFASIFMYLSGVLVGGLLGIYCIQKAFQLDEHITLNSFHGYAYDKPLLSFFFLLACLAVLGFPFTPTFIGIDSLLTKIHTAQLPVLVVLFLLFTVTEIALLRIYARVFLGQHKVKNHPIAFKSS